MSHTAISIGLFILAFAFVYFGALWLAARYKRRDPLDFDERDLLARRGERIADLSSYVRVLEVANQRLAKRLANARKSRDMYQAEAKRWRVNHDEQVYWSKRRQDEHYERGFEQGRRVERAAKAPTHE